MTLTGDPVRQALLRRGFALEYKTLAWNVIGIVVLDPIMPLRPRGATHPAALRIRRA